METETLRYTPGNMYAFVRIKYQQKGQALVRKSGLYDPKNHDFVGFDLVLLRCERRERVHWEYDDTNEKKYDGFIFTQIGGDDSGRVFHNQYPVAHFGQLDDSANYRAKPARTAERIAQLEEIEQSDKNAYLQEILGFYEDAFTVLGRLIGATSDESDRQLKGYWTPEEQTEIEDVTERLRAATENLTGKKLGYREAIITFTDGRPPEPLKGYLEPYIIEVPKAA